MQPAARETWWRSDARQGRWPPDRGARHAARAALALWAAHARPLAKGARVGRVGHVRSVLRARFAMWRAACVAMQALAAEYIYVASRVGYRLACAAWGRWRQLAFWRALGDYADYAWRGAALRRGLALLRRAGSRRTPAHLLIHPGDHLSPPRWLRALRAAHAEWRRRSRVRAAWRQVEGGAAVRLAWSLVRVGIGRWRAFVEEQAARRAVGELSFIAASFTAQRGQFMRRRAADAFAMWARSSKQVPAVMRQLMQARRRMQLSEAAHALTEQRAAAAAHRAADGGATADRLS